MRGRQTARMADETGRTDWTMVVLAVFGGIAAALQIGKASAILGLIGLQFGVGVSGTALYLSLFSIGAALFGGAVGVAATRVRPLRAGLAGLLLIGLGSVIGSFATGWSVLLASRVVEAFGLPLVVSAMPALVQAHSSGKRRQIAMGLWATWLPFGIALALALSLLFADMAAEWRLYMRLCGGLPFVAAALIVLAARRSQSPDSTQTGAAFTWPRGVILAVAALFGLFQAAYLTIQGFLPTIAVEVWSFAPETANRFGGIAALFVVLGNLAAGVLMARHVSMTWLYAGAMGVMALASFAILSGMLPPQARLASAILFTTAAGIPPAVIWALVPRLSSASGAAPAIVSGVLYQGAGLGQLSGPVLAGASIEVSGGWIGAAFVTGACAVAAALIARRAFGSLLSLEAVRGAGYWL